MTRVQRGHESHGGTVDSQPVGVQGVGHGLGAVAHVLAVLGLDFGALGKLEADPLTGFRLAHWSVLFPGFGGWPLDGPVLLGLASCGLNTHPFIYY